MYCRYCGKEIPSNSNFCPNCGKKQSENTYKMEFHFVQRFGKYKKVALLYIIWCLIHIGLLIFSPSGEGGQAYAGPGYGMRYRNKIDAFYPFDTSLSDVLQWKPFWCDWLKNIDVYDSSELFFYTILLPIMIWGVVKVWPNIVLFVRKQYQSIKKKLQSKATGIISHDRIRENDASKKKMCSPIEKDAIIKTTAATASKNEKGKDNSDRIVMLISSAIGGIAILTMLYFSLARVDRVAPKPVQPVDTDSIEEVVDIVEDKKYLPIDTDSIEEIVDSVIEDDDIETTDNYQVEEWTTGDTPYSRYYGDNMKCRKTECSGIKVTAPETSDVVVIVKKRNEHGKVAGHVYISAGDTYKIDLPDGVYQTFFYYGYQWSPYKDMGNGVKGGFVRDEVFAKDNPQEIYSAILSYVLQLRRDGNFHTESSNRSEMF